MSNDNDQIRGEVLETLVDIKELLTPKPDDPIQIQSNDQKALNASIAMIADGRAVVVPAETSTPVYPEGVKRIAANDQSAINRNIDAIATGRAVIV